MIAHTPLEAVDLLDEAFNRGDLETILGFYEDGATMVVEPGRLATGKDELRAAFQWILSNMKGIARQEKTHVIESGDIALFTSRWNYSGTAADGAPMSRQSYASVVLRRHSDGGWRVVVDNSWGPAVLG
ncbi:MAG TPA: nuclear transport factor 2 family protein [Pyrinomonadaceae bacterium]|jgi:uncharacterized protein (TIGR02246 family)